MKRFHFHLQPVLDLREGAEQKAKEQLAETMAVRAQGRKNLDTARELVDEADVAARQKAAAPISAAELAHQQLWRERLERYRTAADQQLADAELDVTVSREALVEAHRKRAALDKLKDVRRAAHLAEVARVEALEADEIALRQYHAKMRKAS
ncbi:MAG: flagellar export protein FliJ [Solirubrobacteraceae bacterium]|nr:flagellar export protein FliJ [Solirubrobacteraceae bacterium]